jgi:hypothetical protein
VLGEERKRLIRMGRVGLLHQSRPARASFFITARRLTLVGFQDKSKTVLTLEDLSSALAEYGINARKPEYYL